MNKIAVVDLEASCYENKTDWPINESSEIIEIGVSILNTRTLKIEKTDGIIIKPTRSKISKFCTNLTSITQEQADNGILLKDACQLLKKSFDSNLMNWGSWGDYDRAMLYEQCRNDNAEFPFGNRHINIKHLFSVVYDLPREFGLTSALKYLKIPLEGKHHCGKDDAHNTAKILAQILSPFRRLS